MTSKEGSRILLRTSMYRVVVHKANLYLLIYSFVVFFNFFCEDLNLGKLATGFGLIKMPVMPELKDKTVDFDPVDIDVENIRYKNKTREKERKRKLQERKASSEDVTQQANTKKKKQERNSVPWSKNKERKTNREKRKARREFMKKQRQQHLQERKELEELAREASLLKKFRSGKITKVEFDSRVRIEDQVDD